MACDGGIPNSEWERDGEPGTAACPLSQHKEKGVRDESEKQHT